MMPSANINGIRDINLPSQKLNGKKEKMKNCLELLAKRVLNNGRK